MHISGLKQDLSLSVTNEISVHLQPKDVVQLGTDALNDNEEGSDTMDDTTITGPDQSAQLLVADMGQSSSGTISNNPITDQLAESLSQTMEHIAGPSNVRTVKINLDDDSEDEPLTNHVKEEQNSYILKLRPRKQSIVEKAKGRGKIEIYSKELEYILYKGVNLDRFGCFDGVSIL